MTGSAIRALSNSLMGSANWTEQDFTPEELVQLRRAYQNSQRRLQTRGGVGGLQYGDYPDPTSYSQTSLLELPKKLMSTGYNVTNTLGRAQYFTSPEGNVIIQDTYDFNPNATPKGNDILSIVRRNFIEPNAKPFNMNINIGNPNKWTAKDLGL